MKARSQRLWLLLFAPLLPLLALLIKRPPHQEWQPEILWQGASVTALHFSPDGKLFAVGDAMGWVRMWKVGSKSIQLTVRVAPGEVRWLKFSSDSRHFLCQTKVVGSLADSQTQYWSLNPLRCLHIWNNGETVGAAAVVSPDGNLVAMSVKSRLQIWDLRRNAWLTTITPQQVGDGTCPRVCVTSLSFTRDSKRIAGLVFGHNASFSAYNLQGWSVKSGHLLWYKDAVQLDYPAACGVGGLMNFDGFHWELLDTATGNQKKVFLRESSGNPHVAIALSPDETRSAAYDFATHNVTLRDVATETEQSTLQGPADLKVMGVSPDYRTIAIGDSNNTVTLWHRLSG